MNKVERFAILDSGAHSAEMGTGGWDTVDPDFWIENLVEFHEKYQNKFEFLVVPDKIGDSKATEDNTFNYFNRLKTVPANKVMPVYHIQCKSLKEFDRVIDYSTEIGAKRICLGGALGKARLKPLARLLVIKELTARLRKKAPKLEVHLLGITEPNAIKVANADSIDSFAAGDCAKNVHRLWFDSKEEKWVKEDMKLGLSVKESTDKMIDLILQREWINEVFGNYDEEELRYQFSNLSHSVCCAALNIVELEEFNRLMNNVWGLKTLYIKTCGPLIVANYPKYPSMLGEFIYKNRGLLSFSRFWDAYTGKFNSENLLNLCDK